MATSERFPPLRLVVAALCIYGVTWHAGAAATLDRPPLVLTQADPDAAPDDAQSSSGLLIRIERLEDRIRSMTGQIEQLQFQNKKLEDELRKMQQDVDFRFQDLGRGAQPGALRPAPQKRGDTKDASDVAAATLEAPAPIVADPPAPVAARTTRHAGDAFDPGADPNAPGAPKPLGTTAPSEPLMPRTGTSPRDPGKPAGGGPHAPMDLMPGGIEAAARPATPTPGPSASVADALPDAAPAPALRPAPAPAGVASLAPGGTRSEYDSNFVLYKDGQFDAAANGFQSFVQKYPKDRLAADATYFLGESYARLGRHREAAEQFLKLSTDYTRSTRAPDALLRLGIALNALGAKEQACATYQEVDRKYPTASADVRAGVERELKRSKC